MKHIDRKTSILLSILFPVFIVVWNLGFDLGAFHTVLYRNLMNAWVFATATLTTLLYLKWLQKTQIEYYALFIIFIPVLWPLIDFIDQHIEDNFFHYLIIYYNLVMAICLGFTLYVFLKMIKFDIFDHLTKRHLIFVIITVFSVTFLGFQAGYHHYLFLACGHFKVSGEFVPPNCYKHPNPNFHTFYRKAWQ
jgi:hypothetical protein